MPADTAELGRLLLEARARTERMTCDLDGERLLGPKLDIVNPPLWELGHVAWFQERWCLRTAQGGLPVDSVLPGADVLYDSSAVPHDSRWDLRLPGLAATQDYMRAVLGRVQARLADEPENVALGYFARLALYHEDMHAEAFHYTRQTLGYTDPVGEGPRPVRAAGDVALPGGRHERGARPGEGFIFDNEKWAHEVAVASFRIGRAPVTNGEYLKYVGEGGAAPRYWQREGGPWRHRRFDQWVFLCADEPVLHVSALEAEAYCRWAGRRLPTEAEWEYAVGLGAIELGDVWEWTASAFLPYPGFWPDPYEDYSRPWFGTHRVLRGGSFSTRPRLVRASFRNFYMPQRADVFCGFRTCAA